MVEAMVRTAGLEDSHYLRENSRQGFVYRLPDGSLLNPHQELERMARLAIPLLTPGSGLPPTPRPSYRRWGEPIFVLPGLTTTRKAGCWMTVKGNPAGPLAANC